MPKGWAMARQYGAFLVRCWRLGDDLRFEIAHIQSGASVRATTLDDAIAWIGARLDAGHLPGDGHHEAGTPGDETAPAEGGTAPR
jgi:hypothetical protein